MMQQYGVVTHCRLLEKSKVHWKVVYSTVAECRNAKECLKIEGVIFKVKNPLEAIEEEPTTDAGISRSQPSRESRRGLIEMRDLGARRRTICDDTELADWSSPPKESCCHRFCCHFVNHPIKILCLPRLIWWILILACALLTPIIAYVIAEYFELEIYRVSSRIRGILYISAMVQ